MIRFTLLLLLFAAFHSLPAAAQDLGLVSTDPADGASDVQLETIIVLEFDEPLHPSTSSWNTAVVEPSDQIYIQRYELCVNPEPCGGVGVEQRYVRYIVQHEPGTDYTWFINGAKGLSGNEQTEPNVLRYTTAPEIGSHSISGAVVQDDYPAVSSLQQRSYLRSIGEMISREGLGDMTVPTLLDEWRPRLDPMALPEDLHADIAAKDGAEDSRRARQDGYTRILLLDAFSIEEGDWLVQTATAIHDVEGTYSIDYVRNGTYWPLVVHYTDATAAEIDALGFYDMDDDFEADSVVVDGSSLSDVDLSVYSFPLTTEQENLEAAWAAAHSVAGDHALYVIDAGYGSRPSGRAYTWNFRFFSPGSGLMTDVVTGPLGTDSESTAVPSIIFDPVKPLPAEFVSAETALQTVLASGGQEFLSIYRPTNVLTFVTGGNLRSRTDLYKDKWFWYVDLMARTSSSTQHYIARVDMLSGELLEETSTSIESGGELPERVQFAQNFPNPFSESTSISFELDRASTVTLVIYNTLGQRVAMLLEEASFAEGVHQTIWRADSLPSGLYICSLRSGGQVIYQPIILKN